MPLEAALEQGTTLSLDHQAVEGKHCYLRSVWSAMGEADRARMQASPECDDASLDPSPFDAVLFNNGQDISALTECGHQGSNALRALESDFPRGWFEKLYPADLLASLSCGEHVYALPVGIHRLNHVIYNRSLFERAGYVSPSDLDLEGLLQAARKIDGILEQEGKPSASVFAVQLRDGDALSRFFIENVMLATSGAQAYVDYWTGRPAPDGLFAAALEKVQQLAVFFGPASDTPVTQVLTGDAAMFVTGDWAMVDAIGSEAILGSMPFPGTQQHWVYSADVFALPVNGDEAKGLAWLHAITQPQAQADFAELKYAIPARLDVGAPGGMDDPRPRTSPIRALPALLQDDGAFGELGQRLVAWAESFGDPAELVSYAASARQSLVDRSVARDGDVAPAASQVMLP
jgi:ABC-type glycerol-3-phosphate transport system substrate-binding protein